MANCFCWVGTLDFWDSLTKGTGILRGTPDSRAPNHLLYIWDDKLPPLIYGLFRNLIMGQYKDPYTPTSIKLSFRPSPFALRLRFAMRKADHVVKDFPEISPTKMRVNTMLTRSLMNKLERNRCFFWMNIPSIHVLGFWCIKWCRILVHY